MIVGMVQAYIDYGFSGAGYFYGHRALGPASLVAATYGAGKGVTKLGGKAVNVAPPIQQPPIVFGSSTKSSQKLSNQMAQRGWTESSVRNTVDNSFATRPAVNRATGNPATAYFNRDGSHVIIDNITREVIQVSDRLIPGWRPDPSIINPFIPRGGR